MARPKASTKKSARVSRRAHPVLAPIVEQLRTEYATPADARNRRARIDRLAARLHAARAPEEDKLLEKDQLIIDLTDVLDKAANAQFAAGNITRIEALLFLGCVDIFNAIEDVLWELKGKQGPKPKPRPLPKPPGSGPSPSPGPSPGPSPSPGPLPPHPT
jgi:hypothetical protein